MDRHRELITELLKNKQWSKTSIAKHLQTIDPQLKFKTVDSIRFKINRALNRWESKKDNNKVDNDTVTDVNDYQTSDDSEQAFERLSAEKQDGTIMTIEEYCKFYGLDFEDVSSYKLVTHTQRAFYNVAFRSGGKDLTDVTLEFIKESIAKDLESLPKHNPKTVYSNTDEIVLTIADLHFGAYIDGLVNTHPFSISILAEKLQTIANIVNKDHKGKVVHVHILGDLIESFTGLNHMNSWKGLQKGMIGAEVVKLATQVLHERLLSQIELLGDVKIISGNHDRVTAKKEEDTDGDAANLIAWGLELIGYTVEYNPFVITHLVDNVNYILLHGHDAISKKSTKDICWDYGQQGVFNFITEGHLHSIIEKLSANQRKNYHTIKDDAVDHRRMNCPSLFTGNSFSERLGYTSNSGFLVSKNNGKGVPHVFFYAI